MGTLHNPFCRLHTLLDLVWAAVTPCSCQPRTPCCLSDQVRTLISIFECARILIFIGIAHVPWSLVPPEHNCLSLSSVLAHWSSLSTVHAPFTSYVASARPLASFIECARSLISHVDSAYSFTSLLHAFCDLFCLVHIAPWSMLSTAHAH